MKILVVPNSKQLLSMLQSLSTVTTPSLGCPFHLGHVLEESILNLIPIKHSKYATLPVEEPFISLAISKT
jgi:hypothetical protein